MGERQGDREVRDGLMKDCLDMGIKPAKAREMADTAIKEVDRRQRKEGKR